MSRVYVVDDDAGVRDGLAVQLESANFEVESHADAETFLRAYTPQPPECLVLDMRMPDMSGLELQTELERRGAAIPIIFLTAYGDIPTSVRAVKAGAIDFLIKPIEPSNLLAKIERALKQSQLNQKVQAAVREAHQRLARLTPREREILELAVTGLQNKDIALRLGISYRTVELHRAHALHKTGTATFLELARLRAIAGK